MENSTITERFFDEANLFMKDLKKSLESDKHVILHCKETLEYVIANVSSDNNSRISYMVENCLRRINEDVLFKKKCIKCHKFVEDNFSRICNKCLASEK